MKIDILTAELFDSQRGFTLIEALIAITIFAVGFLALSNNQLASVAGNAAASQLSSRTTWAADQIEEIISLNYADALLDDDDANGVAGLDETGINADGAVVSDDGLYNIYWNVAADTPAADSKTLRIIVLKVAGQGAERATIINFIKTKI